MSFEENIKKWVALDNKIKSYNDNLRSLREDRNNAEKEIMSYATNTLPDNAAIKISDGILKFSNIKQQQPLTYKYIQECLMKIIDDEEKVNEIISFIKENKPEKISKGIKRSYD
tara:strand:+ start:133 stop:474 length:342 start_codon:yes stop_codon:yes gene_type:complete